MNREKLMERKELYKAFKAALALQGIKAGDFAKNLGVSYRYLLYVLYGQRSSKRVESAIRQLIQETLGEIYEQQDA